MHSSGRRPGAPPIRLLIVDAQPAIRRVLRLWLQLQPDLAPVGEAGSGAEAALAARHLRPDVVLLAAELPGIDAAIAAILTAYPAAAVLIQGLHDDASTRAHALAAGAAAFVGRSAEEAALLAAIRRLRPKAE